MIPLAKQKDNSADGAALLRADFKSGSLAHAYIFYGEESYLRGYYLDQLHTKAVSGPAEAFNFHRLDAKGFSLQEFADAVEALPVMSDYTMIQIDDLDLAKLDEATRDGVADLLTDLPDYLCLVFHYDTVEYKLDKRQKKLAGAVAKSCREIPFPKQSQASLTEWCLRHFKTAGKTITNDLCAYLIFATGGTMTALKPEIEKLCAYASGSSITRQDIDAVVIPVLDAQVFDITDALGEKNFSLALQRLQTVFQMQEEPIPVLAAIAANLRRLLAAKTLSAAGRGADELMRVCGMGDYPARKTMTNARKFSQSWCENAVRLAAETDFLLKSSAEDPERLVERLLLQLAEEARHA